MTSTQLSIENCKYKEKVHLQWYLTLLLLDGLHYKPNITQEEPREKQEKADGYIEHFYHTSFHFADPEKDVWGFITYPSAIFHLFSRRTAIVY